MSEVKTYNTSDLYLAAFLKLKGQKFEVEKVSDRSNTIRNFEMGSERFGR